MVLLQATCFNETGGSYCQPRGGFIPIALFCSEASAQRDLPHAQLSLKAEPGGHTPDLFPSTETLCLKICSLVTSTSL